MILNTIHCNKCTFISTAGLQGEQPLACWNNTSQVALVVKNHLQCRKPKRRDPWVGKIPWRPAWQLQVFLPEEFHGQWPGRLLYRVTKGGHEWNNWAPMSVHTHSYLQNVWNTINTSRIQLYVKNICFNKKNTFKETDSKETIIYLEQHWMAYLVQPKFIRHARYSLSIAVDSTGLL